MLDFLVGKAYFKCMKKSAIVGERGQVTIPKYLRKSLGIKSGSELCFEEQGGRLVATRIDSTDPIESLIGLGKPADVDALLIDSRGPGYNPSIDGGR
jgi:AbrB family looped-hinge helix DNA binding protein